MRPPDHRAGPQSTEHEFLIEPLHLLRAARWQFAPHWTAKVEYQHLQFDGVSRDFNYAGFPTAFRHFASNSGTDTVRVGVSDLFNLGGPVVAKY
jgi:hypothetical protein